MATFEPGDLVRVPFPYTDRPVRQRRPALVVAAGDLVERQGLLWVVMVTSATHRRWPGDVEIADHVACGLPAPSIVRPAKIATIEGRDAAAIGRLPRELRDAALDEVARRIGR